jgi:hypothetical protein
LKTLNKKNILFILICYAFFSAYAQENWLEFFLNSKKSEYYLFTDKDLKMNNIDGTIWIPENVIENSEKKSNKEKINTFYTKGYLVVNKTTILELYIEWTVVGNVELEKKDLAMIDIKISEIKSIIVLKKSGKKSINNYYQFSVHDNKLLVKDLTTNDTQKLKLSKTISTVGDDGVSLLSEYIRSSYY